MHVDGEMELLVRSQEGFLKVTASCVLGRLSTWDIGNGSSRAACQQIRMAS